MNDDLISRQAVLDRKYVVEVKNIWHMTEEIEVVNVDDIKALPSVNPQKTQMIDKSNFDQEQYKADLQCAYDCGKASVNQQEPKTGHWIKGDINEGIYCSECNENVLTDYDFHYIRSNFCPNCGCRMVEPQESEDKE